MDYNSFEYKFNELKITRELIASVMGYQGGVAPDPFPEMIDEVLAEAPQHCDIKGGYTIRENIHVDKTTRTLRIEDVSFQVMRIITNQLKKSEHAALFVCTAGAGIGEWSKKLMKEGDLMMGYVVDVVGSETVDGAMDIIQKRLEENMMNNGLHITERYSPGYCDWQVSEQQKLFSFFPDQFCGISLSPSSLMYPIKSISGVIGIGKDVKRNGYACNMCDLENCIYRDKRHVH